MLRGRYITLFLLFLFCLPILVCSLFFFLPFPVSLILSCTSSVFSPLTIWPDFKVAGIHLFQVLLYLTSLWRAGLHFKCYFFSDNFFLWQRALMCGRLPNYLHPPLCAHTHTCTDTLQTIGYDCDVCVSAHHPYLYVTCQSHNIYVIIISSFFHPAERLGWLIT